MHYFHSNVRPPSTTTLIKVTLVVFYLPEQFAYLDARMRECNCKEESTCSDAHLSICGGVRLLKEQSRQFDNSLSCDFLRVVIGFFLLERTVFMS